MTRHLLIVRHAKSSWSQPNLADLDRPLNPRGRNDADRIGNWLKDYCDQHGIERITELVSPAMRTRETVHAINACLDDVETDERLRDEIYLAGNETLLDVIQQTDAAIDNLMLVGHNPGMHELVEYYLSQELEKFPTCAVAYMHFDCDSWQQAVAANCRFCDIIRPKQLRAQS